MFNVRRAVRLSQFGRAVCEFLDVPLDESSCLDTVAGKRHAFTLGREIEGLYHKIVLELDGKPTGVDSETEQQHT